MTAVNDRALHGFAGPGRVKKIAECRTRLRIHVYGKSIGAVARRLHRVTYLRAPQDLSLRTSIVVAIEYVLRG